MPTINAFRPVVYKKKTFKIYKIISYLAPYWDPKGASPFI